MGRFSDDCTDGTGRETSGMDGVGHAVLRTDGKGNQLQAAPIGKKHPGRNGEPLPEPAEESHHADPRSGEQRKISSHESSDGPGGTDDGDRRVRMDRPVQKDDAKNMAVDVAISTPVSSATIILPPGMHFAYIGLGGTRRLT